MQQLSIYCSLDLEDRVVAVLDAARVEGFFRAGTGTGNRFLPAGQLPRTVTWEAALLIVPAIDDGQLAKVRGELNQLAESCEFQPCLRLVASPAEVIG